ncbi:MAG: HAMP domain-containing histidine kinase [Candidatus Eremiobacteraeota bacterium]|nr:HAMP domain-containing histidine kinase [Candidatus Eremiobacteraeota bacterium]
MTRSLRWRIASFYAVLLLGVVAVVAVVLTIELHTILLDEARAKIDKVGADIAQVVRGNSALNALGDALPIEQELTSTGVLDHWSGPTTYVEIDTADGYPLAKSTNMGGEAFVRTPLARPNSVAFEQENQSRLGDVLVRVETIVAPNVSLIVKKGESLAIYDETLARIRTLLGIVVVFAAIVVFAGSFAIAASALEPIGRLSAAMGEIRSDRLSARLAWSDRDDELGRLAASFDAMLDRLEDGFARERQFISDASHELKTPLTVINANAQMLERWADRDPQIRAESLAAIREESASLAGMVNGMLLLAKAESGDDIPRETIELETVIADVVRHAQPRADEKGLALQFARPHDGTTNVLGNANLLRQLFTNLIDNAIKFTEHGAVDVSLQRARGEAVVSVSDTGAGIEEEALERVFDRFFREDESRNRAVPGTGLGLAIVRSIARIHGGGVVAERRAGGGTTFDVTLPTLTALQ